MDQSQQKPVDEAAEKFAGAIKESYQARGPVGLRAGAQRAAHAGVLQRGHRQPQDPGLEQPGAGGGLIEQQRKQREASQALAREGANAYVDFMNSMFSYYRGNLDEAQKRANG
jgi:hypothetical protein